MQELNHQWRACFTAKRKLDDILTSWSNKCHEISSRNTSAFVAPPPLLTLLHPGLGDDELTISTPLGHLGKLQGRGRALKDVFGSKSADGDK
jgi:hypothetical protein